MSVRWLTLTGIAILAAIALVAWFGASSPGPAEVPPKTAQRAPEVPAPVVEGNGSASLSPPDDPTGGITLSEDLWPNVDWDEVRAKTPGSLVWTQMMPADTEAERRRRADRASADNESWGRIQAGMAESDEIERYYDAREDLLTDNLEFVGILLEDHRNAIPERDLGLLEMAFAMTYKRIQKLPEERERAFRWQADHADRRAEANASP